MRPIVENGAADPRVAALPGEVAGPRHAIQYGRFVLFLAGSFISWVGDWMDLVALNWVVFKLTGSPIALGVINACRLVPVFVLSIPAGVLADRWDRRRLLIGLQLGLMVLTFLVAVLVAARSCFLLFAMVVTLRSIVAAMVPPVRNVLIPGLVPTRALASAIASQTAAMNLARIVGPAVAGILLARVPMEAVFTINGASFIVVLVTLYLVRPVSPFRPSSVGSMTGQVAEALGYIRRDGLLPSLLILAIVPMVFGFPYIPLMPLFARDLFNLGPEGFGALLSIAAVGALLGSVWLSVRRDVMNPGRWLVGSVVGFGLALLLFVAASSFLVASIAIFLVGMLSQVYRTMSRITLQLHVPDALRGRILSIALMDRGFMPLGAVMLGAVAETAGTLWAGLTMGVGCVAVTLMVLAWRRQIWDMAVSADR